MNLMKLLVLFTFTEVVHSLVEIELSVLQFDNPLGTSYTGQNLHEARKCCDTGGSNCRNTSDTCDVYFTFCIGSLSHSSVAAGCNGTSVDMSKDVSYNVFKITDTRRLRAFTNITSWVKGSTQFIVNVLDLDELQSPPNDPHVFPDLIDAFNNIINFEPAQNFWFSEQHVISLVGHVSLDVGIRAWCASGWYGYSCESQCTADAFHTCSLDGTQLPNTECTDINTLVLSLNTTFSRSVDKTTLKRNITRFLAENICLKTTDRINITIQEIREHRDGHIDVVFNAFCDDTTVSNLKFRETLYVFNQVNTLMDPPESYFKSQVIPPRIPYVTKAFAGVSIVYLVRYVHFVNNIHLISPPLEFTVSFPESKNVTTISVFRINNLTDCNGVFIDLGKQFSQTSTSESTMLYGLSSYQNSVQIAVGDPYLNHGVFENHIFSLSALVIGMNFRDSYPKILPTSIGLFTSLTIEVMAWCVNCHQGEQCQVDVGANCKNNITVLPPDCRVQTECKHGGRCVNHKCKCLEGWTGPTCNTDIDECALGVCEHIESCTNTPGGYNFMCSTGFSGKYCEVDIDECSTDPCNPGLECLNTYGSFACIGVCADNTLNPNCIGNINYCSEESCQNNATCVNNAKNYTCKCSGGWSGNKCEIQIDECKNLTLCQNGGKCIDSPGSFSCWCPNSYTGQYCDSDVNECLHSGSCSNNGTCANTPGGFTCMCPPGYTGNICEVDVDECLLKDLCRNNGTCVNKLGGYTCACSIGYSGVNCQQDIDECADDSGSCNNNGTCENTYGGYTCLCLPGYIGNSCNNDVNECLLKYCQHGQCSNFEGGYNCLCEDGWGGQNCSVDRHECSSVNPCFNGGTCINNPDVFSLEFVGPISDDIKPKIKDGIVGILKLLMCHDSTIIDVSLVQNSITLPNTVEFHAQCDGHHLTNDEINDSIRTLSDEKLMQYFPIGLKNTHTPPAKQDTSWVPAVVGSISGLVVINVVAITAIYIKRRKNNTMSTNEQAKTDSPTPTSRQVSEAAADQYEGIYDEIQSEDLKMTGGKRATFVSHKELLRMNVYNEIPEITVCSQNSYEETVPNQADNAHVYSQLSSFVNTYEAVRNKDSNENPYSRISHKEAVDRFGSSHESIKDSVDERRYLELSYLQ